MTTVFVFSVLLLSLVSFGMDGTMAAYALSTWAIKLGGSGTEDMFRGIEQSSNGGYIFVGETDSFGAGSNDAWLVSMDEDAEIEWQKTYGGKAGDTGRVIRQTPDGGFAVAGQTHSFGSGSSDFWLLKFDSGDNLEWQKAYGGPRSDIAHALELTSDGGYLLAGFTTSFGAAAKDYFVVKLNSTGGIEWQKRYGGSADDVIRFAKETSDGKYVIAGFTHSFGQNGDILVMQLDESGNLEWQKSYGGGKFEEPGAILEVSGGYIVLEQTASFGGGTDGWIFKVDTEGGMVWQKRYSGNGFDELSAARETPDGGFIVVGETRSFGAVNEDFWVIKFDSSAHIQWQKRYGGSEIDEAEALALTPEGGYIIAGITRSFGAAGKDIWIIRLDSDGGLAQCIAGVNAGLTTSGVVKDTSASPEDVELVVANTNAAVKNSNAIVMDTDADVSTQCSPSTVNEPPVSQDDSYFTGTNEQLVVTAPGVLENDSDDDADLLTASVVLEPDHGQLALNQDGGFTYTPDNDFEGTDSFTYRANDGIEDSNTATVSIQVTFSNSPPVADDANVSTQPGIPADIVLTGSDEEDDASSLTFYIASLPQNGALAASGPDITNLTYTPDIGFTGTDSFTFVIYDTDGARSNTGVITVEVSAIISPPGE